MNREPLVTVAGLTALVGAVIALAVSFGLPLSKEQEAAILGLTTIVAPLVVAALVRPKVTPAAGRHRGDDGEAA